jgi:hypothetical protein
MNINFYLNVILKKAFTLTPALFFLCLSTAESNAQRFYSVVFNQLPQDYQLYPRDSQSQSKVPVSGYIELPGYSYMSVQVFRNDKLIHYLKAPVTYKNGTGSFSTESTITAELAEYDFRVFACKTADSALIVTRENVVSGDVYILTGQSNSTGFFTESDTHPYCRTFGKITGTLNTETYNPVDTLWSLSNQQPSITGVGSMGFEIQKQLAETYGIPNCLINGGFHWSSAAAHAQRNRNNPADLTNGYGRMLYRVQKAGLVNAAKTFIFRQGETEAYHEGSDWPANFDKLYHNLKLDLPHLEKLYVFQIDIIYYQSTTGAEIRDYQRRLPQIYPDVEVLATVGTQQFDGLHYRREGNRQNGLELSRLIAKDFYSLKDTLNIYSPAIKKVFYKTEEKKQLVLTFDEGQQLIYPEPYKPNDQVTLNLKDFFYLDHNPGNIKSGIADNNRIILELSGTQTAATMDYLPPFAAEGGIFYPYTGPYIKNKKGMRALTFYHTNISDALKIPVLTASIDPLANTTLSWNTITDATGYILERKRQEETAYKTIAFPGNSSQSYQDNVSSGSGKVSYRLKAINKVTESGDYGYAEVEAPVVLGIQPEKEEIYSVYPNPVLRNDKVLISFKKPFSGSLILVNTAGQIVYKQSIQHKNEASLKTSDLPPAMYYIQLKTDGTILSRKLLVR